MGHPCLIRTLIYADCREVHARYSTDTWAAAMTGRSQARSPVELVFCSFKVPEFGIDPTLRSNDIFSIFRKHNEKT